MIDWSLDRARQLDTLLLRAPRRLQYAIVALTFVGMILTSLPHVPRVYVDYADVPLLAQVAQPDTYGSDTIGAMYVAKVALNDVADLYAREHVEQTALERATWSKEASAPYPPATLLGFAALYAAGEWTGVGYYGAVLVLAGVFLAMSAWYFLDSRWYLFPALYANFAYFGERFT